MVPVSWGWHNRIAVSCVSHVCCAQDLRLLALFRRSLAINARLGRRSRWVRLKVDIFGWEYITERYG